MPQSNQQVAFPKRTSEQMDRLRSYGKSEEIEAGQVLFAEGDRGYDFFLLLEGTVEITEHSGGEEQTVTVHEPGEFTGDVDMLTGRASLVTATVKTPGEMLRLGTKDLRTIIAEQPALSDLLLKAFLMRRTLLLEEGFTGLQIVGSRYSKDTMRLKEFAARNHLPFTWLDLETAWCSRIPSPPPGPGPIWWVKPVRSPDTKKFPSKGNGRSKHHAGDHLR